VDARGLRLTVTVFLMSDSLQRVRMIAHVATRKGAAPAWVKALLPRRFAWPVMPPRRAALKTQLGAVARSGAPSDARRSLDFLLPAIRTLAAGETLVAADHHETIE
jgi:hypothetical protein